MRIKRTSIVLAIGIILWASVLYFAILNRHDASSNVYLDNDLSHLENGIAEQVKSNQNMIYDLHKILESKPVQKNTNEEQEEFIAPFKFDSKGTVIPVLVFACNRVSVTRCLDQLLQYRPNPDQFPIIVSQVSYLYIHIKILTIHSVFVSLIFKIRIYYFNCYRDSTLYAREKSSHFLPRPCFDNLDEVKNIFSP